MKFSLRPAALALCTTAGLGLASAALASPPGADEPVGPVGRTRDMETSTHGYAMHHSDGPWSYWWNENREQCVQIYTPDERFQRITLASPESCGRPAAPVKAEAEVKVEAKPVHTETPLQVASKHEFSLGDVAYQDFKWAQTELRRQGFMPVRMVDAPSGLTGYYWNGEICIAMANRDGKADSVQAVRSRECG